VLDTVHYSVGISVNTLTINFFHRLVNKINVPMFNKQQDKDYKNAIKHVDSFDGYILS
jgi:hypothetical protein